MCGVALVYQEDRYVNNREHREHDDEGLHHLQVQGGALTEVLGCQGQALGMRIIFFTAHARFGCGHILQALGLSYESGDSIFCVLFLEPFPGFLVLQITLVAEEYIGELGGVVLHGDPRLIRKRLFGVGVDWMPLCNARNELPVVYRFVKVSTLSLIELRTRSSSSPSTNPSTNTACRFCHSASHWECL